MDPLSLLADREHEHVSYFRHAPTGIQAIIAVHSTAIGPGLGGCRIREYNSLEDGLRDVLLLSEAMSYKNALCGIDFGGGKSVILAPRDFSDDRAGLFSWFGECVQSVGGKYITAEDMGTSVKDIGYVRQSTDFAAGTDPKTGGGGDPSPWTALGVFEGIKACLEHTTGSSDLAEKHVAIQGVGNVGSYLAKLLSEAGARLTVYDNRPQAIDTLSNEVDFEVAEDILSVDCDVLSPCAAGQAITEAVATNTTAKIIAGGANNQLVGRAGEILLERGISYAPDFAINSGGVILCAEDYLVPDGGEGSKFDDSKVRSKVMKISDTVSEILNRSKSTNTPTQEIAVELAKERISRSLS